MVLVTQTDFFCIELERIYSFHLEDQRESQEKIDHVAFYYVFVNVSPHCQCDV